jgi:hypothetical protein
VNDSVLRFRLTHYAFIAALVLPAFLGKIKGLGFSDGC